MTDYAETKRAYYQRMKDDPEYKRRAAEASARWRARNPEKVREIAASEAAKKNSREYNRRNPDVCHKAARAYHERNKGRRNAQTAARRAATKSDCPRITALYALAAALRAEGRDVHVDHIMPLAKGGAHVFENLRIIPAIENLRKGARI